MAPRILLGALAVCFALVLILSDRPWSATNMPRIAEIDVLPDGPEMAAVREYTEYGSGILPWMKDQKPPAPGVRAPVKVGWIYREFGLLRMPFWAKKELGPVTYIERPDGIQFAVMMPDQVALLESMTRKKYSDWSFPIYLYLWGWLLLIGFLAWLWLNHRARVKWREEHGII